MNFIKQCKAKDMSDVNLSKIDKKNWIVMPKYDGNYVQIHKIDNIVRFFTSGGEEFYLPNTATQLILLNKNVNFAIEAEFIAASLGKKGDRTFAAKLTTYRADFKKGIKTLDIPEYNTLKVFDAIHLHIRGEHNFASRLSFLKTIVNLPKNMTLVETSEVDFDGAISYAKKLIATGYEGAVAKHINHVYKAGKVNTAIKIKERPTADLLCTGVIPGVGKYAGKIGSLLLKDSTGREVAVGSGLSDVFRNFAAKHFIGKVVEIEYEQILNTYIQPTFVRVREKKEID
ncbi:MAG: hypothetical protein AB7D38_12145 [Sulfurimonas sp.]|uniref:ATP-dependent DNA ligase n=1 Tax=Sulfurimonas sp. TaxID=2022749 RepID=UPI003D0BC086